MGIRAFFRKLFSNQRGAMQTATKTGTKTSTGTKVAVTLVTLGVVGAAAYGFAFAPGAPLRTIRTVNLGSNLKVAVTSELPTCSEIKAFTFVDNQRARTPTTTLLHGILSSPSEKTCRAQIESMTFRLTGDYDFGDRTHRVSFKIKKNSASSERYVEVGTAVIGGRISTTPREFEVPFNNAILTENIYDSSRIEVTLHDLDASILEATLHDVERDRRLSRAITMQIVSARITPSRVRFTKLNDGGYTTYMY